MHLRLNTGIISMQALKTKEERLKEGLSILKQLMDAGVSNKAEPFLELQKHISEWVSTGKTWDGRIEFPEYGRYALVELPKSANVSSTLAFKRKVTR
jgi:hypothetical protein